MIVLSHGVFEKESTAVCSCSDCIGIRCRSDRIQISCWLDCTQDDHITPTALIASLIAHAHRLAMQDLSYKGLHAGRLYWFVYLWWVNKQVPHGITECFCMDFRTDCTSTAYTPACPYCLPIICVMCIWHLLKWLYTCWLHNKALVGIAQLSCIFSDPNMSPFALIPDLLHLHWLHHGLHRGHNWLQCIAYSLHCRCAICHMIACIYSMKDPASALTALIIVCASIKEVIVAQFFQDLVFSLAFQNSVGQIAYWISFALPA